MREPGLGVRCMGMGCSDGRMGALTKGSTSTIRSTATGSLDGKPTAPNPFRIDLTTICLF